MNCFKRILPAFIIALFLSCAGDFKEITDEERQARQPQSSSSEDLSSSSSGSDEFSSSSLADLSSSSSSEEQSLSSEQQSSSSDKPSSSSSNNKQDCGSNSYDPAAQFCLGGQTVTNLCGGNTFYLGQFCGSDNKVHDYCNGSVYNVLTLGCCANAEYTLSTHFCHTDGKTYSCNNKPYDPATQFCSGNSIIDIALTCGSVPTSGAAGSGITPPTLTCNNDKDAVVSEWNNAPNWDSPSPGEYNISVKATCGTETVLTDFCGTFKTLCADFNPNADTMHYGKLKKKFCDERDGKRYVYVKIGEEGTAQTWMAENLNYRTSDGLSRCYGNTTNDDDNDKCAIYGRLYRWATAMGFPDNCNTGTTCLSQIKEKHQGICPDGWHIPSSEDLDMLIKTVDGTESNSKTNTAAIPLKAMSGWDDYSSSSGSGMDDYGFSALPGGYHSSSDDVEDIGLHGYWWNKFTSVGINASRLEMKYSNNNVNTNTSVMWTRYSVRCLRD